MSKKSKVNQVSNEIYYGSVPLLRKDKIYGFWDVFLITGAWAIATWAYVQGGENATIVGLKEAFTTAFFGMTLAGIMLTFCTVITTRYGIDIFAYMKALFGYVGLVAMGLILLASLLGYDVINTEVYGSSMMKVLDAFGISLSDKWTPWISITCVLFGVWIALRGPIAVKYATRIMVPALMALGAIIVFTVFLKYSLADLMEVKPLHADEYGSTEENYMTALEWNISFIFAWFTSIGIASRLTKTERKSYWGHLGGFSIVMASFVFLGTLTALAMVSATGKESTDPTDWLIELGGPVTSLFALLFIAIANITTVAVSLYGATISTKVLMPKLNYKITCLLWAAWIVLLVFWGGLWEYYSVFLAVLGASSGSATSLIIVDFFVVRKRKVSMKDLYQINNNQAYKYSKGFNIPALFSFFAGISGYLLIYDPVAAVPRHAIFQYTTATGFAVLVSGLVYLILSLLTPVNNYLRQDIRSPYVKDENNVS